MDKKIKRALAGLNAYIDDDRQKLCDRIHLLEKSHKRLDCLLSEIFNFLKPSECDFKKHSLLAEVCDDFCHRILKELNRKVL